MPLGAPVPPPGTAGGGGGKQGGYIGSRGQFNPQQAAMLNWLQGASGQNLGMYQSTLSNLGAQRNAIYGAYGNAAGSAGRDYGLTLRGIEDELKFGTQLRDQERYRNVDLGRSRSIADYGNAQAMWNILRGDIGRRAGFNTRNLNLGNAQVASQYNTGMRTVGSDAVARGARTAAGTLAQFGDVRTGRDQGLARNRLDYDVTKQGLDTEYQRGAQGFKYAGQQFGIDKKTFDSLAKTYGIQAAQAVAQAALARDRAAANRSSAVGSAGAQRAQALAGLGGAQQSAYNQYMNTQMGLMQQLYGM